MASFLFVMPLAAMVPKAGAVNRLNRIIFWNFWEKFLEIHSIHYVIIKRVIRKRQKLDILNWSLGFTYFKWVKLTHPLLEFTKMKRHLKLVVFLVNGKFWSQTVPIEIEISTENFHFYTKMFILLFLVNFQ